MGQPVIGWTLNGWPVRANQALCSLAMMVSHVHKEVWLDVFYTTDFWAKSWSAPWDLWKHTIAFRSELRVLGFSWRCQDSDQKSTMARWPLTKHCWGSMQSVAMTQILTATAIYISASHGKITELQQLYQCGISYCVNISISRAFSKEYNRLSNSDVLHIC